MGMTPPPKRWKSRHLHITPMVCPDSPAFRIFWLPYFVIRFDCQSLEKSRIGPWLDLIYLGSRQSWQYNNTVALGNGALTLVSVNVGR